MGLSDWLRSASLGIAVLVLAGLGLVGTAAAAPGCGPETEVCPPFLGEFGENGAGAGQINNPRGIAADPVTGHVFVAENAGRRVSEFDATDEWKFVAAWGWGVIDGSPELQVCTVATGCMQGLAGSGAGQISAATGIVLDREGFIWTLESESLRMQKFSSEGEFVLMVGGEVNKTKVKEREEQEANAEPVTVTEAEENLCAAASGDECGAGTSGTGQGQFKALSVNNPLAVGPDGTVYVGDENRIQEFAEDGTYKGDIALPGAGLTRSLAVDPTGRIYVISASVFESIDFGPGFRNSRVVREISPAGAEVGRLLGEWQGRKTPIDPVAVTSDANGNVYVSGVVVYDVPIKPGEEPKWKEFKEVVAFDSSGNLISFEPELAGFGRPADKTELISLATNVVGDGSGDPGEVFVGHFVSGTSYVRVYGTPFEPSVNPPVIEDQYATSVGSEEAEVEALINPKGAGDTTYQVQYGTESCGSGGCESTVPAEPAELDGGAVNTGIPTGPVVLGDLEPGTTYHYRFIAENAATDEEGTGPVLGAEATFRTYLPLEELECPNDQLREESQSLLLADCRAYEMVSPIDKEGGEVFVAKDITGYPSQFVQGAPSGEALTYSSYRAFVDPKSAPYTSQYLSHRDPSSGWSSEHISPEREGVIASSLETQYRQFTEDLSLGWLVTDSEPVLDEGGIAGYRNLYRRDNAAGTYQAQCPELPPSAEPLFFFPEPQGSSTDGSHFVFRANDKLSEDAAAGSSFQLYECIDGDTLRLVSVLPGGGPASSGASAGMGLGVTTEQAFHRSNVATAISVDGERIFWTASTSGPGALYVRIGGSKTVEIAASGANFRAASSDGTRVLYTVGDGLFEAEVGEEAATSSQIAGEVGGFVGASADAELVYFLSREDLDAGGAAAAGKPNLYLYRSEGGTFTFVATLSADDAREAPNTGEEAPILTPVALAPYNRSSRVSPDGLHAAFTSSAPLTGYDNTDQQSGQADAEVFLYDATSEELHCASCNPSGARPRGADAGEAPLSFWAAAKIPGWYNQAHGPRALSDDGERLYFEAIDPLSPTDTNEVQDVYQWQAPGSGTCAESSPTYSPANGGCIDLLSSGQSPQASFLVDASTEGSDVFFKTTESLWEPDPGLYDVYDARVGGGFPLPPEPKEVCEGNCQSPTPAPGALAPSSSVFVGPGNVVAKPKPRHCRKGTHRVRKGGKARCVASKKGKAGNSRRAGR